MEQTIVTKKTRGPYKKRNTAITQQSYKIENNIPISGRIVSIKDDMPFAKMKVGDSFFADVKTDVLASRNYQWRKKNTDKKFQFTVRTEKKGSRVWRIK